MHSEKEAIDLNLLASDIVQGKVYGSWMLTDPSRLGNIFLPLGLGAAEKIKDQDIWAIYEYRHKTTFYTEDGLPIFMSFKTLSSEDCKKLRVLLKELFTQAMDGFDVN